MTEIIERLRTALADRYEVAERVGEGGMATVFRARDLKHNRDVAIKVFRPELSKSIGTDRFDREIEIAARLQHPHILPVYDSGEADGLLYYVMPYVEGESLKQRIERGTVPASDAIGIAREVASALNYAHEQGVVHRDIKPANILLSQGHAVVADFGIARAVSGTDGQGLTQVGMAVGTPWYMSPEQAMADPNVDGRTDVYALGCVLFEMLEGHPPFEAETPQGIIAKTISSPAPGMDGLARRVPAGVPAAIARALEKEPNNRFQTAGEFGAALNVSTGEFVGGTPSASRQRWLAVAAVVALVIVGGLWLTTRGAAGTVATGADVVAVLPFEVAGVEGALGEGMVSLLSTNLNAAGHMRTVDARTVLQKWRSLGGEAGLDFEGALQVGRDVQAGSVLMGSVVAAGTGVRFTAEMYTVDGEELARIQLDGDADNVLGLVDSLSLEILRDVWRSNEPLPSFDVAAITSGSLDAVRAYMRGALYFRQGQWTEAATAFQDAVAIDSTFAMAHLALSEAYGWTGQHGSELQREAVEAAGRFVDRLPLRERALVKAYELNRQGDPAAIDSARSYTRRYPQDPSGWYALADFLYHRLAFDAMSPEEQLAPFDSALARDSTMAAALVHPMEITLVQADRDRLEHYLRLNDAAGASDRGMWLAHAAIWGDDLEERTAAFDSLLSYGMNNTAQLGLFAAGIADPDLLSVMLQRLSARAFASETAQNNARFGIALFASITGRDSLMTAVMEELPAGTGPAAGARAILGLMRRQGWVSEAFPDASVEWFTANQGQIAQDVVVALLALDDGDAVTARAHLPEDVDGIPQAPIRAIFRAIDAWATLIEGDTAIGLPMLDAAIDTLGARSVEDRLLNILPMIAARTKAFQPPTHDEGVRELRYGIRLQTAAELVPRSRVHLGEALEAAGDRDGAIAAYEEFLRYWANADASLQGLVDDIRSRVVRLQTAGAN